MVLQNVKVLGMDLNVDPTTTQSAVAHTATLEVTVQDAQRLAVAQPDRHDVAGAAPHRLRPT